MTTCKSGAQDGTVPTLDSIRRMFAMLHEEQAPERWRRIREQIDELQDADQALEATKNRLTELTNQINEMRAERYDSFRGAAFCLTYSPGLDPNDIASDAFVAQEAAAAKKQKPQKTSVGGAVKNHIRRHLKNQRRELAMSGLSDSDFSTEDGAPLPIAGKPIVMLTAEQAAKVKNLIHAAYHLDKYGLACLAIRIGVSEAPGVAPDFREVIETVLNQLSAEEIAARAKVFVIKARSVLSGMLLATILLYGAVSATDGEQLASKTCRQVSDSSQVA